MNRDYRLGIIGFGGMAGWHREIIDTIDNISVKGVFDIDNKRMKAAAEFGLVQYRSAVELVNDKEIDIVLIATPNDVHKSMAITAMKAGKAVVCEKPVTLSSYDLSEMINVSKATGCLLTVHQNRRFDEDFLTIEKVIDSGKLGEIFRIESRVHGSRGIPGDWRQEKEHGGGMVLDWGVHMLDQILLMKAGRKVNTVYATMTNVTNQLVDDGFTTVLTFDDGVEVLVEVGTSNFISLPRWYVLGSNGTAVIEDWELNGRIVSATGINEKDVVPVRTAAGLTKTMAPRRDDSIHTDKLPVVKSDIRDYYKNVMAVLDKKEKPIVKLPEVSRVMRLMETIFEAAEKKQIIEFER